MTSTDAGGDMETIASVAEMLQIILIGLWKILALPFEFFVMQFSVTAGLIINGCFKLARWYGFSMYIEYASGHIGIQSGGWSIHRSRRSLIRRKKNGSIENSIESAILSAVYVNGLGDAVSLLLWPVRSCWGTLRALLKIEAECSFAIALRGVHVVWLATVEFGISVICALFIPIYLILIWVRVGLTLLEYTCECVPRGAWKVLMFPWEILKFKQVRGGPKTDPPY